MQPLDLRGSRSNGGGRRTSQRSSVSDVVRWVTTLLSVLPRRTRMRNMIHTLTARIEEEFAMIAHISPRENWGDLEL